MPTFRHILSLTAPTILVAACTSATPDAVSGDPQYLTECDGGCTNATGDGGVLKCDGAGQWAIRVDTPVKWNGSFILKGGQGTVTNWLLSSRTLNGLDITDSAVLCGAQTPDYQSVALLGGENYGITFPDGAFDKLGTITLNGTLSSTDVGATYSSSTGAALVGASLANPSTDAWPASGADVTARDDDGDGHPGVTALSKTGAGYSNPPVNITKSQRAAKIYTAFRQVLASTAGTVTSCTRVDGTGKVAVLNNKAAIDTHILGCAHASDGADCAAGEAKLLDGAAPVYQPTGDSVITMVKVSATTTCADVKALDFASQP
jgi:hypothetical protein